MLKDKINPPHYKQLKGIESIELIEQFNFCLGNAIKYILRCDHKGDKETDIKKAIWYLERELKSIGSEGPYTNSTDPSLKFYEKPFKQE
ncbi:MAG: DUF3310 domain-containing protein [Methanosarcinales archaeon]|nr:DUF3310 domain-containing protein [Methanosarcinales archaeon]